MSSGFAVADTSAIISYFLGSKSTSFAAVQLLLLQRRLIASSDTFSEFREVLLREKFNRISIAKRLSCIASYQKVLTMVDPHIQITSCVDPKDNKFLSLAVSGNASLILTNDDHLLRLHPFRGIRILTPQQYLDEHAIPPGPR